MQGLPITSVPAYASVRAESITARRAAVDDFRRGETFIALERAMLWAATWPLVPPSAPPPVEWAKGRATRSRLWSEVCSAAHATSAALIG